MLVTFFGSVTCVISWGFGLVVGAMFAREVARLDPGSDYPLLAHCLRLHWFSHLGWRLLWINASVGCNTGQPG